MYKKLTDDKLVTLIEAGISEFAEKGYERANLSGIAKAAGISVGVIYKYYEDKEALFIACVRYSLNELTDALKEVAFKSDNLTESIKSVVHTVIVHAKTHSEINRMYHEITSQGARNFTKALADEVEGISALVYTDLFRKAQDEKMCREDADPEMFAFFFDNLLMMIQFSFCCDYYRERLRLYAGADIFENEERVEGQLVKFLAGALGIGQN